MESPKAAEQATRGTPWPDLRRPLALSPLRGKAPKATQGVFHFSTY